MTDVWRSSEDGVGALTPERQTATPAAGGEPVAYRWKYKDEESWTFAKKPPDYLYYGKDVICEPLYAAQPASPLRGREALEKIAGIREYSPEDYENAARYKREEGIWTVDEYLADAALSSAPPEQP